MEMITWERFHKLLPGVLESTQQDVCCIRIIKEDDNTFDIRIWDEREDNSREDLEEARFETVEIAQNRLLEIIEENKNITFLRVPDEL